MEDYKSNSHKSKEEQKGTSIVPEKKVEKVVSGTVKPKKKGEIQKFADVFISEDVGNVKSYLFGEVLIPAAKKAISDVVTNGIDMILYGEAGRSKKNSSSASKVSYRSYYDRENDRKRDYAPAPRGFDYDNLLFENRGDAEAVLDAMNDIISQYGVVSVADLYDLANANNENWNANKYGWTNIQGCKAVRVRDGYILKLPRAIPLN